MVLDLKNCKVRWDRERYIPKKVYDFEEGPFKGSPKEIGERFLKENLGLLKITATLNDIKFDKVNESLSARTVLFQQYFEGIPIHGAWISVHINKDNKVFMVKNDTVPIAKLEKKITKSKTNLLPSSKIDQIIKKKIKEYGTLNSIIKKEGMIYPLKGILKRVWKVKFGTSKPAGSYILFIESNTGHILEERNVLRKSEISMALNLKVKG